MLSRPGIDTSETMRQPPSEQIRTLEERPLPRNSNTARKPVWTSIDLAKYHKASRRRIEEQAQAKQAKPLLVPRAGLAGSRRLRDDEATAHQEKRTGALGRLPRTAKRPRHHNRVLPPKLCVATSNLRSFGYDCNPIFESAVANGPLEKQSPPRRTLNQSHLQSRTRRCQNQTR